MKYAEIRNKNSKTAKMKKENAVRELAISYRKAVEALEHVDDKAMDKVFQDLGIIETASVVFVKKDSGYVADVMFSNDSFGTRNVEDVKVNGECNFEKVREVLINLERQTVLFYMTKTDIDDYHKAFDDAFVSVECKDTARGEIYIILQVKESFFAEPERRFE